MPSIVRAAGLLAASLLSAPAAAHEHARMEPLRLGAAPAATAAALVTVPTGWRAGDAAAVLLGDGTVGHDRVVGLLLDAGLAVLEFHAASTHGERPRERAALQGLLHAAADGLTTGHAAGPVLVLGFGPGGDAALALAKAAPVGVVAAGRMGPGAVRLAAVNAPAPAYGMPPLTAGALCMALAGAEGTEACRQALAGPIAPPERQVARAR